MRVRPYIYAAWQERQSRKRMWPRLSVQPNDEADGCSPLHLNPCWLQNDLVGWSTDRPVSGRQVAKAAVGRRRRFSRKGSCFRKSLPTPRAARGVVCCGGLIYRQHRREKRPPDQSMICLLGCRIHVDQRPAWFGQRLRKQPPDDLPGRWQPSASIHADATVGALKCETRLGSLAQG
jgi:hypothetical protein